MIPIYKTEVDLGLKDKLAVAHTSALCICQETIPEITQNKLKAGLREKIERAFGASEENFDLFPLYTVLVSTGWNKNDDVFGKVPTWLARYTPEDKPFNLEHEPSKIIGHITASCAVDDTYLPIADDITTDELPSKYHILTSAVIYKPANNRNPDWSEATNKLIDEIREGKWCVSMECLFNDFDYAVASDGKHSIVSRNEETAFLTKHLRVYGGEGQFQNMKIGRYLKNITFSGKGLTQKPANPDSVIFTDTNLFNGVFASISIEDTVSEKNGVNINRIITDKENEMPDETVVNLEKENTELKAQIAELTGVKEKFEEVNASVQTKEADLVKANEVIVVKDSELVKANEAIEGLKVEVETLKTAQAASDEKISSLSLNLTKANRTISLYQYDLDPAEVTTIIEKFVSLADEQFNDMVALIAAKKKKMVKEDEVEDKEEGCASETSVQDAVASAEATTPEIPANTGTEVPKIKNKVEQAQASIREYFSKLLTVNKK